VLGAVFVLSAFAAISLMPSSDEPSGPPRAAIVDQLSFSHPNPSFVEGATATLERAGYLVDYYRSEEVTVDFYRHLPGADYDYVILRAHSASDEWRSSTPPTGLMTLLFTSERYSRTAHPRDYERGLFARVRMYYPQEVKYFGIGPHFINQAMVGEFNETVVVAMGCRTLESDPLAEAFLAKGAAAFIGWTDDVSADHSDATAERLLQQLVNGTSPQDAVARTTAAMGPDPAFGASLRVYQSDE